MSKGRKMKHHLSLRTKDAITGFLFTLPALVGLGMFFVVPFGITMKMSLTESMGSSKFVGLKNYRDVLGSAAFKLAAKNTFKFFGVALPCILILSLLRFICISRYFNSWSIPYFSCSVIASVFLYLAVSVFALSSMENGMSSIRSTPKLSTATKRISGLSSPVFR